MTGLRRMLFAGLLLGVCGCEAEPLPEWLVQLEMKPDTRNPTSDIRNPTSGDRTSQGAVPGVRISGRVVWDGEVPRVEPFSFYRFVQGQGLIWGERPNPNRPRVHPDTGGLGGVVVYLAGDGLRDGREWDHPPVTVEMSDLQIQVRQGDRPADRVGIVRVGDEVAMVSREAALHSVRVGSPSQAYTLKLPRPDVPLSRVMPNDEFVELASASHYFWARAYLFVADHPYYAVTDEHGRYELPDVPPGEYRLSCWVPDWQVVGHERDPETGDMARQWYGKGAWIERPVTVAAGRDLTQKFWIAERSFGR